MQFTDQIYVWILAAFVVVFVILVIITNDPDDPSY